MAHDIRVSVFVFLLACSVRSVNISTKSEVQVIPASEETPQLDDPCAPCLCREKNGSIVAVCTNKNLTSVPNLHIAKNVSVLLLDFNHLDKLENDCFINFTNLLELNLASNKISVIDIWAFRNLDKLEVLNLQRNVLPYVESVFNSDIFKSLRNLKSLNLNGNAYSGQRKDLKYPDKALSYLVSLQQLHLDGLTNQSFGQGFSNLVSLTHLSLAGEHEDSNIVALLNTTFTHISHVKLLNISNCNIVYIEPAAFVPLKSSLEVLDISYNRRLKMDRLFNGSYGWQNSSLRILNISYVVEKHEVCVYITKDNLKYMRNTIIEEIYADGNRIQIFEVGALQLLPRTLRKVTLRNSWFAIGKYIEQIVFLQNLTEIDLSGISGPRNIPIPNFHDQIDEEDQICSKAVEDVDYEWLEDFNQEQNNPFDLQTNLIGQPIIFLPPKLETLKYTYEELAFEISELLLGMNELKTINVSYNLLASWKGPVTGLSNLTNLDLSNNDALQVHSEFFENLPSLTVLNISHNLLKNPIMNDVDGVLFKHLSSLQYMDLSFNNLDQLPEKIFTGLPNLEFLILSWNNLYNIPIHVNHMKNLRKIDFSRNKIRWLSDKLTFELDSLVKANNHSIAIDLSHNPISCECPNLWFLKWMLTSPVILENMNEYYCLNESGHTVHLADLKSVVESLEDFCFNYVAVAKGTVLAFAFLWIVFFACLAYQQRWKLRYWYYGIRYSFKKDRQRSRQGRFPKDAFISYSTDDQEVVQAEMYERLVTEANKKLTVHGIDFIPGTPITINIIKAVKESRKTVLVISENFIESEWCMFEMRMAIEESAHRNNLLLLTLGDFPYSKLPHKIRKMLETGSYIEFQHEGNRDEFWERFVQELDRP